MEAFKTEATVLFCDIRNFTALLEARDPMEAVTFANDVLAVLGEEVERNGGIVDRFTGDGFLAHFGAISELDNHEQAACRSAIDMRNKLQEINTQRYLDVESVVSTGIGIHTGTVAVGEITTGNIMQKTVLGDVVNTTARIETLTKFFSVDILISQAAYKCVADCFQFKKMPVKKLRGKHQQIQTWWLLPMNM